MSLSDFRVWGVLLAFRFALVRRREEERKGGREGEGSPL